MTRRPFDPRELDTEPMELDPVARELSGYADLTAAEVAPDLAERVMAAVDGEPTPRRSLLAMLFGPSAAGGGPRLLLVGATMVLGVLAVVLAGRLAGLLPDDQIGPSPSPSIVELPTASPTPSLTPSLTPSPTPTEEPSRSPRASRTPRPSPSDEATSRPTSTGEDETPEPSEDNSGPGGGGGGGGDDNSGPGGGGGGGDDNSGPG